jgi:hypothetical protein
MSFPTDDIFLGPKSFGPRKGSEGNIWHTTEGTGPSRTAAVATATWQKTNPGSYNFIIYDGGVLLTVPYLEASGGVNPASPAWAPERFPWLKEFHSPAAYADPNAYLMNIAFSGKAADLAAGKYPANMIDTAARLIIWFEGTAWGKDDSVHSGHNNWQSNRSDPGSGVITKILTRYSEIKSPPPAIDYRALYEAEKLKVTSLTTQLAAEKAKVAGATAVGFTDAKAKAIVSAENHLATVRALK